MVTREETELKSSKDKNSKTWIRAVEGVDFKEEFIDGDWVFGSFNFKGWVEKSKVLIPQTLSKIPYISQWGIGAKKRKNDCGLACISMIAASRGIKINVDDLSQKWDFEDDGTTKEQVLAALTELGINAEISQIINPTSIALVWYRFDRAKVWDKNFYGLHWLLVLEITPEYVVCHDPNFLDNKGENIKFSRPEWNKSYANTCVNILPT